MDVTNGDLDDRYRLSLSVTATSGRQGPRQGAQSMQATTKANIKAKYQGFRHKIASIMGVLVAFLALASMGGQVLIANAGTTLDPVITRTYKNVRTGLCLDSNPARKVYTLSCNGGSYQRWTVSSNGDGTVMLRNLATSFCLDSNTAGQVYTLSCNWGSFQHWKVLYNIDGTVSLRNLATSFCLDSNTAGQVYTLSCNGGSYQRWH
jgi:serine/threonine-protein kinase